MIAAYFAEEWRPVVGFPDYEISSLGNVRRVRMDLRGHKPKQLRRRRPCSDGYVRICLSVDNTTRMQRIHRLVLEAFVGPCPAGFEADHIDRDKSNNALANLRWLSKADNLARRRMPRGVQNGRAKMNEASVRRAREMFQANVPIGDIARAFGLSYAGAASIIKRISWKHAA